MIEILIPVRNPGEVFGRTIDSLLAQTDRAFTVLISDNYSTSGLERIEESMGRLREAGIATQLIKPPWELGRVEHWNWLHHQSTAAWLKPLFVGDYLEPECVRVCRETMAANPGVKFFFFQFRVHRDGESSLANIGGLSGPVDSKDAMRKAIFEGNFAGGPINVLYSRAAFQAVGGHHTSLTLMADFDLYTRLAANVPSYAIAQVLGHFVMHGQRYAKRGSGTGRESMNAEWVLAASMFAYTAICAGQPIPNRRLLPRLFHLIALWAREWAGRMLR